MDTPLVFVSNDMIPSLDLRQDIMSVAVSVWKNLSTKRVQELRFLFCSTSDHSAGVRNFIKNQYQDIKADNPKLPILIRESNSFNPIVIARFDYGVEHAASLSNASEADIAKTIANLVEGYRP